MEYCNNIGIDKKFALYFSSVKKKTDYIYDSGKSQKNITVMQRSNVIDVFNNLTGEKLFELKGVESFKLGIRSIIYNDGKHYGAYSDDGKVILEAEYSSIYEAKNYFVVVNSDGNRGVYKWDNNKLKEIIKPTDCLDISIHDKGIVLYKELAGYIVKGYYSLDGKEIIEPKYLSIDFNSVGIYVSTIDGKRGYFSHSGEVIVPPIYDGVTHLNNSFIVYTYTKKGNKKFGLYTNDGRQILKPGYSMLITKSPYAIFNTGQLYGVYDLITGKRILPLKFQVLEVYYNVIYASDDLKTFTLYSAKTGKKLLDEKFEIVKIHDKYILKVMKQNKPYYYLINHNTLIDADIWDIQYSEEYKDIIIKEKGTNSKEMLYVEWAKHYG